MAITDIFRLRPTEQTSASIREALTRAVVADVAEQAELKRLEQERDDLLLDGTAEALAKAEKALATARDSAGRVGTVRKQLEQRLTAAIKAEAVAIVDNARAKTEAASKAHGEWWLKNRVQLEKLLTEGQRLSEAERVAYTAWNSKQVTTGHDYPGEQFAYPACHSASMNWLAEIGIMARMESFSGLASLPSPQLPE